MNAMSIRRDSRSPSDSRGNDERRPRTFVCRDDLFDAFERRANELECSVDWLLGEAMKRLLAHGALAPKIAPPKPMPRLPVPPPLPLVAPPPPPPRSRRATGSFVGEKTAIVETLALRIGDQRTVIDRERFVIGRSARDAQLALRDGGVSRQHAMVERVAGGWVIVDMASTNGVLLNGVRVTRAAIRAGDRLEIGPFTLSVERA